MHDLHHSENMWTKLDILFIQKAGIQLKSIHLQPDKQVERC